MTNPSVGVDYTQRVREFIDDHEPTEPLLPLTHITTMYGFRSIMGGMTLDPTECKVFKEHLLYLFYGRPAYRATQAAASELTWNQPICFILKPDAVRSIRRIFPFDSGAFSKGLYGKIFHEMSKVESFELEPTIESAAKYVSAFYSDSEQYFRGRSNADIELKNLDFELQGLRYLAKMSGLQKAASCGPDERASAVEIQTAESLQINECLLGLIVPETFLLSDEFKKARMRWDIESSKVFSYVDVLGPGSEAWVGAFYEKVQDLYRREGYLGGVE